jgi:tetratricopeptide (TPR) repeat protein
VSPPMTSPLPIDPVFQLVLELPARPPGPDLPRRLTDLFRELAMDEPPRPVEEIEDQIWALWNSHEDRIAEETMAAAVEALGSGSLKQARPLLDHLVAKYPDWPEAWNKRAMLASIEKRDADSLLDIAQTLRLEPRHFGAIAGFGNICLRHGHLNEARAAFQIALVVNPHMEDLRDMLENLSPHHLMLH